MTLRAAMAALLLALGPALLVAGEPPRSLDAGLGLGWISGVDRPVDRVEVAARYGVPLLPQVDSSLDVSASFLITNDGTWNPTEYWMKLIGEQYFLLQEGSTGISLGPLAWRGGWLVALPPVESPYALFLNPSGRAAEGMDLSWHAGQVRYGSRWIGINDRSAMVYGYGDATRASTPWGDRGLNYRVFSMDFGPWRFGYEESALYLDRAFDPVYFLAPLPAILTNTLLTQGGNPWTTSADDNSLMGLFAEYRAAGVYAFAEVLLDDINLNFLFIPGTDLYTRFYSPSLTKLAWSAGGRLELGPGELFLWHAGATEHTFAATYQNAGDPNVFPYEYTWYQSPDPGPSTSDRRPIDPEDSYLGVPYGENFLAVTAGWQGMLLADTPYAFGLEASLEYVINGEKSPHNPWHGHLNPSDISIPSTVRVQLFSDGGVLEHRLVLATAASRSFGSFGVRLDIVLGWAWNRLGLADPGDGGALLWRPVAGDDGLVAKVVLSGSVSLGR